MRAAIHGGLFSVLFGILLSSSSIAQAWEDQTAFVLNQFRDQGLTQVGERTVGPLTIRFFETASAERLIQAKGFDIQDPGFKRDVFLKGFVDTFSASARHLSALVAPPAGVSELTVILSDMGEERKDSISATKISSRVVISDVRRWHKILYGIRPYLGVLTTEHELAHVWSYFSGGLDFKYHRELSAIVVEGIRLVEGQGLSWYLDQYPGLVAGQVDRLDAVLDAVNPGYKVLRRLAHGLVKRVYSGAYAVNGDPVAALRKLASIYLTSPVDGDPGFDEACRAVGLRTPEGEPVTLERLRRDLFEELKTANR